MVNYHMPVRRLARPDAEKLLRQCLEKGQVLQGRHFIEELAAENPTFPDAIVVLRAGSILDEPEPDLRTGEWKYRIEGYEPGGKYAAIVFSFKLESRAFLITVFSIESRRTR
jgi:hypothetical protein